jgi:hypothetical protein
MGEVFKNVVSVPLEIGKALFNQFNPNENQCQSMFGAAGWDHHPAV